MPEPVDVVIPTHDRLALLGRALRSVLAQTAPVRAIVVDDGSSDGTRDWLESLDDPRVLAISQPAGGVAAARNRGLEAASAPWVAFLDDDDFWSPAKLEDQLAAAERAQADIVYCEAVVVDADGRPTRILEARAADDLEAALRESNLVGPPSCVLARRSLFDRAGGFDPSFSVLADWDMWLRLARVGSATRVDHPLVGYTEADDNMHLDLDAVLAEFSLLRAKHERPGSELGSRRWWAWIATSQRRRGRRLTASRYFLKSGIQFGHRRDLARGLAILLGERAMRMGQTAASGPPALDAEARRWVAEYGVVQR